MEDLVLAVVDCRLRLLTLSKTHIDRLDRIENETMWTVLGCTKDTLNVIMCYLLGLSGTGIKDKFAMVKVYLTVAGNITDPLYKSLVIMKGCRSKRGTSWMAEVEVCVRQCCVCCGGYCKRSGVDRSER